MASAAVVSSLPDRPGSSVPRRLLLAVCPRDTGSHIGGHSGDHLADHTARGAVDAGGEPGARASAPSPPSVAAQHAAGSALPWARPANVVEPEAQSEVRPALQSLERELVAMLPSLERRALRWCRNATEAQDLAQDTIVRALRSSPRFESGGHLRAWLYTVLRNLFISGRRRDQSWSRASAELTAAASRAAESAPNAAFLTPSVERAIARLPEGFAKVLRLVDLEDYSYADAASTLGVPVGTVMSRLFRARQRLARDLPALV